MKRLAVAVIEVGVGRDEVIRGHVDPERLPQFDAVQHHCDPMRWRDGRQAKGLGDVQAMDHVMAKCTELAATRGFPPVVDVSPQACQQVRR